ncbi:glucose dehydrogenase [FAD, quinone]-like, partial [Sitodiplosis mosellana]|uniref:glucose dehydrogenase [FAD, quinone]-like n=1 Tax=Sitodiplosis mosellana TaxID=263140 RepID=UPI0024452B22
MNFKFIEFLLIKGLGDVVDFIVVGGASAGCVVAARLSENPKWKVLLLEAGGNPPIESEIPALFGSIQRTKFDWQFSVKSELTCKAAVNETCRYTRGKMLGGTSSLNGKQRPKEEDYDGWAELGNTGWDYDSVLPYFKKSEGNQYEPFGILEYASILCEWSTAKCRQSIFDSGKNRKNVHVIKHAFVKKILIDENNNAYGAKFTYKEKGTFKACARKEVIVSAGSFLSPQLLMNSGIGPKKHLEKFHIPVKADIPVGRNLTDHQSVYVWFRFNSTETSSTAQLDSLYQYVVHGTGPLTSRGVTNVNGFINIANTTGAPNIQVQVFYCTENSSALTSFASGYKDGIKQKLLNETLTHDLAAVVISNIHPKSRGYVKLNRTSVYGKPIVNPRFFSNPDDVEVLLQAMKQQLSFENTTSYQANDGEFEE